METLQSDFKFRIQSRRKSYTALVEGLSTLTPLYGRLSDEQFAESMLRLVDRWRIRLQQLRECEWDRVCGHSYYRGRNCRPCSSEVWPAAADCRLRGCPFCHARTVAWIFQRVYQRVEDYKRAGRRVQVVSYSREFGKDTSEHFHTSDDLTAPLLEKVIPLQQARRAYYRKRVLGNALGDAHWIFVWPVAIDEDTFYWHVRHGNVSLQEADWSCGDREGDMRCDESPAGRRLAWSIAKTFRYPTGWLAGDEHLTTLMLNSLTGQRLLTSTGCLRGKDKELHE